MISPAQAYHGSSMGTLALNGRPAVQEPYTPYLSSHLHLPPSTWRFDPTGDDALAELDGLLERNGGEIAAFFCEPVSAAALPAYSPPERFWRGLAERRKEHGFLICFDEVVTGIGRVGSWLAAHQLPIEPDIVAVGKGLGAGYAPLGAVLVQQEVYDAIDRGSREFDLGHTWDGPRCPPPSGWPCSTSSRKGASWIGFARGARSAGGARRGARRLGGRQGGPRARLPHGRGARGPARRRVVPAVGLDAAAIVDDTAFEHGLLVTSTHPQADGFAGDQVLLAPAYTSTDAELAEMVERFAAAMTDVERRVGAALAGSPS